MNIYLTLQHTELKCNFNTVFENMFKAVIGNYCVTNHAVNGEGE